jgi:hypothetical protein
LMVIVFDVTKYYPDEKPVDGFQVVFTPVHFVHQHINRHELISTLVRNRLKSSQR